MKACGVLLFTILLSLSTAQTYAKTREEKLSRQLTYLKKIPEVTWVQVQRNSVYIGWRVRPDDLRAIVGAAAYQGNRAIGFGVHIYNYDSTRFQTPSTGPLFFCTATFRYGEHKKNNC